jgi:hypothetical protein
MLHRPGPIAHARGTRPHTLQYYVSYVQFSGPSYLYIRQTGWESARGIGVGQSEGTEPERQMEASWLEAERCAG